MSLGAVSALATQRCSGIWPPGKDVHQERDDGAHPRQPGQISYLFWENLSVFSSVKSGHYLLKSHFNVCFQIQNSTQWSILASNQNQLRYCRASIQRAKHV